MDFPIVTFGYVHFHLWGVKSDYQFLFHFSIKLLIANRIAPEGSMRPYSLPMSHKRIPGLHELQKRKTKLILRTEDWGFMYYLN